MLNLHTVFLLATFFCLSVSAKDWQIDSKTAIGSLEFEAVASPGNLKIVGKAGQKKSKAFQWLLKEKDGKLHAAGKFRVEDWDTGLFLRNTHLRENYLHAQQYPVATLKLTPIDWSQNEGRQLASPLPFKGELNLHGKTKAIAGELTTSKRDSGTEFVFRFSVKLTDFEIPIPSFMGVTVGEDISVTAKFLK